MKTDQPELLDSESQRYTGLTSTASRGLQMSPLLRVFSRFVSRSEGEPREESG